MISIRDIAKECGVSVATVSKALNGHHDISAQTRETVCRKAAEMGYQPNSAARALKTNRTYNLGVLYEDPQHSGLGHEYFSRILESFRAQAEACGYDVTFINRNVGKRRSSYLEHCRYRGVDGVCVVCVNFLDPQVLELVQSELPVVTVDHMFNNRTSIVSDNVKGVQTLVNHVFGTLPSSTANARPSPKAAAPAFTRPATTWGCRCPTPMYAKALTTTATAANASPPSCWRCRSGPHASFSPMTCRLWAASPPSPGRASACRKTSPPSVMTASLSPK